MMSDDSELADEIASQLQLLATHRRTLAHLIQQAAQFSAGFVPAHIANGIAEARDNIAHIKTNLRAKGHLVEDHPFDTETDKTNNLHIQASRDMVPLLTVSPSEQAICIGTTLAEGKTIEIPVNQLRKHLIVAGISGTGKTHFLKYIATRLWHDYNVPFLALARWTPPFEDAAGEHGQVLLIDSLDNNQLDIGWIIRRPTIIKPDPSIDEDDILEYIITNLTQQLKKDFLPCEALRLAIVIDEWFSWRFKYHLLDSFQRVARNRGVGLLLSTFSLSGLNDRILQNTRNFCLFGYASTDDIKAAKRLTIDHDNVLRQLMYDGRKGEAVFFASSYIFPTAIKIPT